jgi:hypothetical protein
MADYLDQLKTTNVTLLEKLQAVQLELKLLNEQVFALAHL